MPTPEAEQFPWYGRSEDYYEGEFQEGAISGFGKVHYSGDGVYGAKVGTYLGEVLNGRHHGIGALHQVRSPSRALRGQSH